MEQDTLETFISSVFFYAQLFINEVFCEPIETAKVAADAGLKKISYNMQRSRSAAVMGSFSYHYEARTFFHVSTALTHFNSVR